MFNEKKIKKEIDTSKRMTNKIISIGISMFFLYPFHKLLNNKFIESHKLKINLDLLEYKSIYLDNNVIIYKNSNSINVYQNKCTHLGCTLQLKNNQISCPCHGSKFDTLGNPIDGPAIKKLSILKFEIIDNNLVIEV